MLIAEVEDGTRARNSFMPDGHYVTMVCNDAVYDDDDKKWKGSVSVERSQGGTVTIGASEDPDSAWQVNTWEVVE